MIDTDLNALLQMLAVPNSFIESANSALCLGQSVVYFPVNLSIWCDGKPQVSELANCFQLSSTDGDVGRAVRSRSAGWWRTSVFFKLTIYILSSTDRLFRFITNIWSGRILGQVIPKTQKMVLDASLFNTQHYKVWIKGKWNNQARGVVPSPKLWCSSYWKGSLQVTHDYS